MNEIRGTKVILREQKPEDAGFFAYWFNQPTVMFQCGFTEPTDEEHERKVIREFHKTKDSVWFTITDHDGNILGETGLLRMWPAWHCTDLSIIIPDPAVQHQGYGSEAIRMMLDLAFETYDMNRVSIGVVGLNTNALAFYRETGFVQEGIQEQGYLYNGEYSDFIMMRILRSEWMKNRNPERSDSRHEREEKPGMDDCSLPQRLERRTIYESDYVCLYADRVKLPGGAVIEKYHQIHYPHEAVSVVIFNEKNEILMIRERRYTVNRLEWEIPAGRVEDGEDIEEAAKREALEETGCTLKDLRFLCSQNPANGMSDCTCHVFAARVKTEGSIRDADEVAGKKWMPVPEVRQMLRNNETRDGVSILAILFALEFYLQGMAE